jgi:cytochrome c biogenesis protein CcdA
MNLEILPLAITMMAGPQIISAIIFVTAKKPVPVSLAFVAGVAIATTVGVLLMYLVGNALDLDLGDPSDSSSSGSIIQYALIALLALGAIKNYVRRETVEPPKMLGKLQQAGPKEALRTGLLVILLMPSDLIILLTVGANLDQNNSSLADALPFIGATTLVAALPLLGFLIFHRRAVTAMPKLRDWMNTNAGIVNVIVCVIFLVLITA